VGRDLLTVDVQGRRKLLYPLLATQLARVLEVSSSDLPRGADLEEVARRYLATQRNDRDIYRELRQVLRGLEPIAMPQSLTQLAKISHFKLYVTTTFDVLTERAIDQERYRGQRQTLVFSYAPNDKQDLPPEFDRLNRPTVFHLMGRVSGTPRSYAVTREDIFEFVNSLEGKTRDSPQFLFDKLRSSHLLILGSHVADWLARFFTKSDTRPHGVETREAKVLLLRRFREGTKIIRRGGDATDFVDELYRRWSESQPTEAQEAPPALVELVTSPGTQSGSVFVTHVREDRVAAESIRNALDRAGVDVILWDDSSPTENRWEKKMRSILSECSLFVPVVSKQSVTASRRFFQQDWVDTILEASAAVASGRFILPVVIDDTFVSGAIPEAFGELEWRQLPGGKANDEFLETVVQLQRSYRSTSFA
jgi:hypothetical protein